MDDFNHTDPDIGGRNLGPVRRPKPAYRPVRDTLYSKPSTKICYFYKDGDVNFRGVRIAINNKRYRSLETLKKELTGKVKGLSYGVRSVYTPGGHDMIDKVEDLQDNGRYVCSTQRHHALGVDIGRVHSQKVWRGGRPPSARKAQLRYLSDSETSSPNDRLPPIRPRRVWNSSSDSGGVSSSLYGGIRTPKKIRVIRNGDPSKTHVYLLNRSTRESFENVLQSIGEMFQMPARRLFTLQGRPVKSLSAIFNGPDMYVVSRGERFQPLGAHTDPGPQPHSITPSTSRQKYSNDSVAKRLRDKREKLSKTRGKWKIWVCTSELPSSGTNAQITLTVYGHKGSSGPIPLGYTDGSTFQTGNVDEFEVSVGNIGEIYKIRISHDDSGEFPGWLLDEVRLKDLHTNEELTFKCDRWLSRDEDDHEICRELPVMRDNEPVLPVNQYEVRVETGEVWNGGTDSNVYITLYGDKGDTGVRQLLHSQRADKFRKGCTDVFKLEAVTLGNLKRAIIGHDGTAPGDGWFLERIVVAEKPGGMEWVFACSRWLDEGEDDGKIVRELKPQDEYRQDFIEKQMWEYEKWKYDDHNKIMIYSKLSQLPLRIKQDASLDANGEYKDALATINVLGNKGVVRVFQSAVNAKFHLAIDNAKVMGHGRGGAYCEFKVRVNADRSVTLESNKYPFQFINILQNGKPGDPRGRGSSEHLTDPSKQFFVYCKGVMRDQGVIMFCSSLRQTLNIDHNNQLFATGKRNKLAHFRVHKVNEGSVRMFESLVFPKQYIQLRDGKFDVQGTGNTYCHFKVCRIKDKGYVTIESVQQKGIYIGMMPDGKVRPTVDTGEKNTRFYAEVIQWGIPKGSKGIFTTELAPSPPPVEMKPKKVRKKKAKTPVQKTPEPVQEEKTVYSDGEWKVTITSGEGAKNAQVAMVVYGDKGDSGEIVLGTAGQHGMFMDNNQDQFKVNLTRVGKIYKMRMELKATHSKKEPTWRIQEVKMQDMNTKETLKFKFNRWLSRTEGNRDLSAELPAIRPGQAVLPVIHYKVEAHTANEPGADTDANVYVTVFGERGDTGKRHLLHSEHKQKFQEGQVDTFTVEAVSLDTVTRCLISHDGDGAGEGWMCERVIVTDDKEKYNFPCNKWLDTSISDGKIERMLLVKAKKKEPDEDEVEVIPVKARTPTPTPRSPTPEVVQEAEPEEEKTEPANDGDYFVWVTTGKENTMGTTNQVSLVVYGEKGVSEEIPLVKDSGDSFIPEQVDEFKINIGSSDLGELYKIRIGHSDSDASSGWYLERLKMKNLVNEEVYMFKVNRWLSREQEDQDVWRELPVVVPGKRPLPVVVYTIEVYTGTDPGSDTEAVVSLQLIGQRGDSGKRVLYHSHSQETPFQAGQMDVYKLEAVTLGEVTQVWVGHNGKGRGAGWFCDKIIVKEGPSHDAEEYYFSCGRWLDEGMDDNVTQRLLDRGEPPKDSCGEYEVTVITGDQSKQPNGAIAIFTVYGETGRSKDIELKDEKAVFLPGQTDKFNVSVGDIGELYKIRIARQFGDDWEGWHLKEVQLVDQHTEKKTVFTFDSWLDADVDDHHTTRELAVVKQPPLEMVQYEVLVYTGDHWAAQTDADVYLTVYGSHGDSGIRYLTHSLNNTHAFRRNKVDIFLVEAVSLDDLDRLVVGHTGQGHGSGWFLDKVCIRKRSNPENEWVFPCCRWLDDHEDDKKTERELLMAAYDPVDKVLNAAKAGAVTEGEWQATVYTSDIQGAGTHAKVSITVYGNQGNSGPLPLNKDNDDFEKNKSTSFAFNVGDIGDIYKIRLEHDNSNNFPAWHVHKVELEDQHTGEQLIFYVNRWLSETEEDGALCREVTVSRPDQTSLPVLRYYVGVYTANVKNAATNANVAITMHGLEGDTGRRPLVDSLTHQIKFLKGQIDVFIIEAGYIGMIHSVTIEHDEKDKDSAWLLEKVIIKESMWAVTEWNFLNSEWIEPVSSGQKASIRLFTKGIQLLTPLPNHEQAILRNEGEEASQGDWTIVTTTGNEESTGTDIAIILCGTEESSRMTLLTGQGGEANHFKAGAKDTFKVTAEDIGEIVKIRLSVSVAGDQPNWYLSELKMKNDTNGQEFDFIYDNWIKPDGDNAILELAAVRPDVEPLQEKTYRILVTTGTELMASTEADIYCILFGQFGDTGQRKLNKATNHQDLLFQREKTDHFSITCIDLGQIEKVIVGHTTPGRGKGWYCDHVVVMENYDKQLVFPCNRWLDTGIDDRQTERELLPLAEVPIQPELEDDAQKPPSKGMYKAFVTSGSNPTKSDGGSANSNKNNSNSNNNNNGGSSDDQDEEGASYYVSDNTLDNKACSIDNLTICDNSSDSCFQCYNFVENQRLLFQNSQNFHSSQSSKPKNTCRCGISNHRTGNLNNYESHWECASIHSQTASQCEQRHGDYSVSVSCSNSGGYFDTNNSNLSSMCHEDESIWRDGLNCNNNAGALDDLSEDGAVSVMVYGTEGEAGPIELNNGESDMFTPGKQDEFDLHVGELGELYKIRVCNALGRPWCVTEITLQDVHTKEKLLFDFSKFLGEIEGDIRKELPVIRPNNPILPILQYHVTIETGDSPSDPKLKSPDVFIRLFGERGDSGSRHLNKLNTESALKLKEPNQKEIFFIEAVELLTVNKVIFTKGQGAPIDVKQVTVKQAEYTSQQWMFKYNDVIKDDEDFPIKTEVELEDMEAQPCLMAAPLSECPHLPQSEGVWQVWTWTGSDPSAGTATPLQVILCGEKGNSPVIDLVPFDSDKKPFQSGQTDTFMIQIKEDLGEIIKIRIGFATELNNPSWFLDQIKFEDEATKDEFTIDVHEWLVVDDEHDGWKEYPVLWPGIVPLKSITYQITTHTGDRINAGTDANVYIILHGNQGDTGKRSLKKSIIQTQTKKFEQGQNDIFQLEATDLGELYKVTIGHDGDGIGSGWYLDKVIVSNGDAAQQTFKCDRWLDVSEDDNAIERELIPTDDIQNDLDSDLWKVTVETGNEQDTSKELPVVIVLYGDKTHSEAIPIGDGHFLPGQSQVFEVKITEGLGDLYKVRVGMDTEEELSWQLNKLTLEYLKTGDIFTFMYGYWISVTNESDGWIEIPRFYEDPEKMLKVYTYQVSTKTGDKSGAGTDANVHCTLYGTRGDTGKRQLKYSRLHQNNKFEQDSVDVFEIPAVDLGEISTVVLGHDGEGFGAGWYLKDVTITKTIDDGTEYYFLCDRWLDKGEDDGLIIRELKTSEHPRVSPPLVIADVEEEEEEQETPKVENMWSVMVRNGQAPEIEHTGNTPSQSPEPPSGNAVIVMYGDSGKSEELVLRSANPARFQALQTEQYQVEVPEDLGKLYKIRVGFTDEVTEQSWPVDFIILKELSTEKEYTCSLQAVVVKENAAHDGWREIPISTEQDAPLPVQKYQVEVYTSEVDNAGTEANVYLEIFDKKGDTGGRLIKKSVNNEVPFQKGQVDRFEIEAVQLESLKNIDVWHDGKGLGSGWHLDKVIISESPQSHTQYIFQCQRWLDEGEDDHEIRRHIALTEVKEREPTPWEEGEPWKVWVKTGIPTEEDQKEMQMNGQLSITVYGDKGKTDAMPLESFATGLYQSGQVDEFDIRILNDIGTPYKVRLAFSEESTGDQCWLLNSVTLQELESEMSCNFLSESWVVKNDKQDGTHEISLNNELPVVKYHVEVYTGDVMLAGTDAQVYITLFGERGDTGVRKLLHSSTYGANKFEQDHMDLFELEAVDLLEPNLLIVGHNGTGTGEGWFLEKIVVKEAGNQRKEYVFPCHRWLDTGEDDGRIVREIEVDTPGDPWTLTTVTSSEAGAGTQGPAVVVLYTDKGRSEPVYFGDTVNFQFEEGKTQEFPIFVKYEEAEKQNKPNEKSDSEEQSNHEKSTTDQEKQPDEPELKGSKATGRESQSSNPNESSEEKEVVDVSDVYKVRIGLAPLTDSSDDLYWHVQKLILKDNKTQKQYEFHLDGRIDLTSTNDSWVEVPCNVEENKLTTLDYSVEVYTKEESGAGTDSNVYLEICGSRGDTGKRKLLVSETEGNKFEAGMMDVFAIAAVDLDQLTKVIVGHDGKGIGSGWFLEKVVVKQKANAKKEVVFPCSRWLDTEQEDGLTELELTPEKPPGQPWSITTITSGESGSGTKGPVQVVLYTDKGRSKPITFGDDEEDFVFEDGQTQNFPIYVQFEDDDPELSKSAVSEVYKVRICLNPTEEHGGDIYWQLEKVLLHDQTEDRPYVFEHNGRVNFDSTNDGQIEIPQNQEDKLKVLEYSVEVYTKDESGAGTDSNVYLEICGKRGDTGKRKLQSSETEGNKFESGKMDVFTITAVDLSVLTKVVLGHDGTGIGSGWFLEKVVVKEKENAKKEVIFPCDRWLDSEQGDGATEVELEPEKPADKVEISKARAKEQVGQKRKRQDPTPEPEQKKQRKSTSSVPPPSEIDPLLKKSRSSRSKNKKKTPSSQSVSGEPVPTGLFVSAEPPPAMQEWVKSQMTSQFSDFMKLMEARLPAPALGKPAALGAPTADKQSDVDNVPMEDTPSVGSLKSHRSRKSVVRETSPVREISPVHDRSEGEQSPEKEDALRLRTYATEDEESGEDFGSVHIGIDSQYESDGVVQSSGAEFEGQRSEQDFTDVESLPDEKQDTDVNDNLPYTAKQEADSQKAMWNDVVNDICYRYDFKLLQSKAEVAFPGDSPTRPSVTAVFPPSEYQKSHFEHVSKIFAKDMRDKDKSKYRTVFPRPPKHSTKFALAGEELNENGKVPRPQINEDFEKLVSTEKHLAAKPVGFCVLNTSDTKLLENTASWQRRQLYYQDLMTGNARLLIKDVLQDCEETSKISPEQRANLMMASKSLEQSAQIAKKFITPAACYMEARLQAGRRDTYLNRLDTDIPQESVVKLRASRFALSADEPLFDPSVLRTLASELKDYRLMHPKSAKPYVKYSMKGNKTARDKLQNFSFSGGRRNRRQQQQRQKFNTPAAAPAVNNNPSSRGKRGKPRGGGANRGRGLPFTISTLTSTEAGASTKGPVHIVLYTDMGRSKPLIIGEDEGFEFEDGQTQNFPVYVEFEEDDEDKTASDTLPNNEGDADKTDENKDISEESKENNKDVEGGKSEEGKTGKKNDNENDEQSEDKKKKSIQDVYKVRVILNPTGENSGDLYWLLDKLLVFDQTESKQYIFEYNDRIAYTDDNDGQVEIAQMNPETLEVLDYRVEVYTGDESGAGTDANVYLQICGQRGDTGKRKLLVSETEGDKFESGKMDVFTISAVNLKDLTKVIVGHDGKGFGSGWFLNKVVIKRKEDAKKEYEFICNKLLDEDSDDKLTERTLEVSPPDGECWILTTVTNAEQDAEIAGPVAVQFYGEKGHTKPVLIGDDEEGFTFQSGEEQTFPIYVKYEEDEVTAASLGDVYKIRLILDPMSANNLDLYWKLDKVSIKNEKENLLYEFEYNSTASRTDKLDGVVEIPTHKDKEEDMDKVCYYYVEVYTSEESGSGTDANVHINIHGKHGDCGIRRLKHSLVDGDKFETAKMDSFIIPAVHLGDLTKVVIGHDGKGLGSSWGLDRVIVKQDMESPTNLIFDANKSLTDDNPELELELTMTMEDPEESAPPSEGDWCVLVTTNAESTGGKDAAVVLKIVGEKGDSGELPLGEAGQGLFLAGQTDQFDIYLEPEDVGKITTMSVTVKGDSAWNVDKITMENAVTKDFLEFPVNHVIENSEEFPAEWPDKGKDNTEA